jgi:hypothetical protein
MQPPIGAATPPAKCPPSISNRFFFFLNKIPVSTPYQHQEHPVQYFSFPSSQNVKSSTRESKAIHAIAIGRWDGDLETSSVCAIVKGVANQ